MSSNNTRANVLARANATVTDVFERDTYETESPGDLAVIVAQLHDLVDEDYGSVSDLLNESLHHVTFRHDVDRIQSSGLYELLEVDSTNIGTEHQINAQVANQDNLSILEYAALALRLLLKHKGSAMLEDLELLHIYACLFGKCEILTLALPATWLIGVKDEEIAVWLKEQFPTGDRAIKLRYIAFGQKYVLYGSDSFIGDRIRNGEDTWEPESEIEAPEDHEVPPTDDGLLSEDADHESITTRDEQEAHARSVALAHARGLDAEESNDESTSSSESYPTNRYVAKKPGDLAGFLKKLYTVVLDEDEDFIMGITHVQLNAQYDNLEASGILDLCSVYPTDLEKPYKSDDFLFATRYRPLNRTAEYLRIVIGGCKGNLAEVTIDQWLSILGELLRICSSVTTFSLPKDWVKDAVSLHEDTYFKGVDWEKQTEEKGGKQVLLG